MGRDTKEISAGLFQLPSQLIQLYTIPRFAEIHKYKESIALLSRTLAELGQEVGFHLQITFSITPKFQVNDTLEERVVLEYQLDQLKAIGTGGD